MVHNLVAGKLYKTGTAFVTLEQNRLGFVQVANQKIFRKPLFDTFSYPVSKPSISNPLKMNGFIFHYILHHHIRQYHTCHHTA